MQNQYRDRLKRRMTITNFDQQSVAISALDERSSEVVGFL